MFARSASSLFPLTLLFGGALLAIGCKSSPNPNKANRPALHRHAETGPLQLAGTVWEISGTEFSMMSGGPYAIGILRFHPDYTVSLVRAYPERPVGYGVSEFVRDGAGKWTEAEGQVHFQIVGQGFSGWDFEGLAEGRRIYGQARSTTGASCRWLGTFQGGIVRDAPASPAGAPAATATIQPVLAPLPREESINKSSVSAAGYYGLEAGEADSKNGKPRDASRHSAWVKQKFGPTQAYMAAFIKDYNTSYDAMERHKLRQPTW